MRVAFVGKGGAGKSVISATTARLIGRQGHSVLALDMDTMPGLALSLGMRAGPEGLPEDLAEQREGEGWVMRTDISAAELVRRHGIPGPDGVRLLTLGKLPGHVKPGSTTAFRRAMGFCDEGWSVVGDLAAGTRQAFFGWAGFAKIVVLVVEPTAKSILSARRLALLRPSLPDTTFVVVASQAREPADGQRVAEALGLPLAGVVPYDASVRDAERAGHAPIDAVPDAPAMLAVRELLASLGRIA